LTPRRRRSPAIAGVLACAAALLAWGAAGAGADSPTRAVTGHPMMAGAHRTFLLLAPHHHLARPR
jgi:hypothetical protein